MKRTARLSSLDNYRSVRYECHCSIPNHEVLWTNWVADRELRNNQMIPPYLVLKTRVHRWVNSIQRSPKYSNCTTTRIKCRSMGRSVNAFGQTAYNDSASFRKSPSDFCSRFKTLRRGLPRSHNRNPRLRKRSLHRTCGKDFLGRVYLLNIIERSCEILSSKSEDLLPYARLRWGLCARRSSKIFSEGRIN